MPLQDHPPLRGGGARDHVMSHDYNKAQLIVGNAYTWVKLTVTDHTLCSLSVSGRQPSDREGGGGREEDKSLLAVRQS